MDNLRSNEIDSASTKRSSAVIEWDVFWHWSHAALSWSLAILLARCRSLLKPRIKSISRGLACVEYSWELRIPFALALVMSVGSAQSSLQISTSSVPNAIAGLTYTYPGLSAQGGTPPYRFYVTPGSVPGFTEFEVNSGHILIGCPIQVGTFPFVLSVQDSSAFLNQATANLNINVVAGTVPLIFAPSTVPSTSVGDFYQVGFVLVAPTGFCDVVNPYTWSITKGSLPPGIQLFASNTGSGGIGGIPTTPGTYKFTLQLKDGSGNSGSQSYTISVNSQLDVPLATQDDDIGQETLYDHTSETIAQEGCYLTDAVMLINYFAGGSVTTPELLNGFLANDFGYDENADGYSGDGNVNSLEVVKYAQSKNVDLQFDGILPGDISTVNAYLQQGYPVIVSVAVPSPPDGLSAEGNHWVIITGTTTVNGTDTYTIVDPSGTYRSSPDTLLQYNNTFYLMSLFSLGTPNTSAMSLGAFSPVEMVLTDPLGRTSGVNGLTGSSYGGIPSSSYYELKFRDDTIPIGTPAPSQPEVSKHLDLLTPIPGNYQLLATGVGTGSYTIRLLSYDHTGAAVVKTFTGTTVPGVVAKFEIAYNDSSSAHTSATAFCPADVNGDGIVNSADLAIIGASFGSKSGQPSYNASADLNHDGVINVIDLAFASRTIGCTTQIQ